MLEEEKLFIQAFETCELPGVDFDHNAHLRLAWIYLNYFTLEEAIKKLNQGIRNFDNYKGDGTKYHKTITEFSAHLLYKIMGKHQFRTYDEFIKNHKFLLTHFKALLKASYEFDVCVSSAAKEMFIPPKAELMESWLRNH